MNSLSYVSDEYLLAQAGIDTEKFKLGKLCKRGHDWEDTGKSLRYKKDCNCTACRGILDPGSDGVKKDLYNDELLNAGIDISIFKLGRLCKRSHDWNNTGLSLRYRGDGANCVDCTLKAHIYNPLECSPEESLMIQEAGFNPDKFTLGTLCKNDHDWRGTGKSLRYKRDRACVDCTGLVDPGSQSKTLAQRIWDRINVIDDEDSCWEWQGTLDKNGYGTIEVKGVTFRAHRLAYEIQTGESIPEGLVVRHYVCDNPKCCRGSHLRVGTYKDNTQDMITKRRHSYGENHWMSKLTTEEVVLIKELYDSGEFTKAELSRKFNVTPSTIGKIIKGRTRTLG